jgi:hypothetical protein
MKTRTCAWLLALALMPVLAVAGTTVYRWVDAQGVVHYSDQPHQGARRVQPGTLTVLDFKVSPGVSDKTLSLARRTAGGLAYRVRILAPAPGSTLWPINYKLRVRVQVTPPLQPGAALLQYRYDGKNVGRPTTYTRIELNKVYRGTHTLEVIVMGPRGKTEGRAGSTFYVRQHSMLHPGRGRVRRGGG